MLPFISPMTARQLSTESVEIWTTLTPAPCFIQVLVLTLLYSPHVNQVPYVPIYR